MEFISGEIAIKGGPTFNCTIVRTPLVLLNGNTVRNIRDEQGTFTVSLDLETIEVRFSLRHFAFYIFLYLYLDISLSSSRYRSLFTR